MSGEWKITRRSGTRDVVPVFRALEGHKKVAGGNGPGKRTARFRL
jgi:hypothetical protein